MNWENWDPLKKHEEKIKTRMGNLIGNADKKITVKTGQNDNTKERHWNMKEQKGKGSTRKNYTTWGNKLESTGERRKIKEI